MKRDKTGKGKENPEESRLIDRLIAGIRNREPFLENPENLTDDIMNAIRESSGENFYIKTEKTGKSEVIHLVHRLLAAASVCLLLVFGYEEYIVVNKISLLEKQSSTIARLSQYQPALKIKNAMSFLASGPEMTHRDEELKTRNINPLFVARAAIFLDVNGITPDAFKWFYRNDYHYANQHIISFIKQLDSTLHTK